MAEQRQNRVPTFPERVIEDIVAAAILMLVATFIVFCPLPDKGVSASDNEVANPNAASTLLPK